MAADKVTLSYLLVSLFHSPRSSGAKSGVCSGGAAQTKTALQSS